MKAIIMAGGKGTRLSSVLNNIPKPMVPVDGVPVLEHQIRSLKESGITEVILVIGHLGHVIREYFSDGSSFGVKIDYYEEQIPLGTAGALYDLKELLKNDFILIYGDVFLDIDFQRMIRFHYARNAKVTLFAHPNSHPYDSDLIVTGDQDKVIGCEYKNLPREEDYDNLVNAGIYILSPKILTYINQPVKTDLEKDVIVPLISTGTVYAYRSSEYAKDIGTPDRLIAVEKDYKCGIVGKKKLSKKQKCIFLDRDGTINKFKGLLTDRNMVELENSVAQAIRIINSSEYLCVVITNQPVIARGDCSESDLKGIHKRLVTLLGNEGAYVDGIYFCPHHPHKGYHGEIPELKIDCKCRKPKTGMIIQAACDFNIDLTQSWIVGDTTTDIQTGINAGLKTALVLTGEAGKDQKYLVTPNIISHNLEECVRKIIEDGRKVKFE